MSAMNSEMAELARAMRNFLDAVDVRTNLSVSDAVAMLHAWHGEDAALLAMSHANSAADDDDPIDSAFWLQVYHAIVDPTDRENTAISWH